MKTTELELSGGKVTVRDFSWAMWKAARTHVVTSMTNDAAVELVSFVIGLFTSGKADSMFSSEESASDDSNGDGAKSEDWVELGQRLPFGAQVINSLYDAITDVIVHGGGIRTNYDLASDFSVVDTLKVRNSVVALTEWGEIATLEKNFFTEVAPSLARNFISRQPASHGGSDSKQSSPVHSAGPLNP